VIDVRKAAAATLKLADLHFKLAGEPTPEPKREIDGKSVAHALWIISQVAEGNVTGNKSHRWLGFGQGVLCVHGVMTLMEAKLINFDSKIGRREPTFDPAEGGGV
jgi:hypothetical protein